MHTKKFAIDPAWRLLLKDVGIDPTDVLNRASLPTDLFDRHDSSLYTDEYFRLWQALEDIFDNPAFPLGLIAAFSFDAFDPGIFAAFCAPDLNTALKRLSCFKPLIGPMKLHLNIGNDTTVLEIEHLEGGQLPASLAATELLFFVHLARTCTRCEDIMPVLAEAPVPLLAVEAYSKFLGVTPGFGPRIKLEFSASDAKRPFLTANKKIWEYFEPTLRKRLSELDSYHSFSARVHASLLEMLPAGESSMSKVAENLLVSTRTLQRRLSAEGTTFQALLRQVREQLARHYLTKSDLPGVQISFLLGFDDPNSFFRAFQNWTGTTPESVRQAR